VPWTSNVEKDHVLSFIRANGVRVEETVLEGSRGRKITDFVRRALADKTFKGVSDFLRVSDQEAAQSQASAGLTIRGFSHSLDDSAVRHIMKSHGDPAAEKARGQAAITEGDFAAIPDVINAPDVVVYGMKNKLGREQIAYIKKMPDGSTLRWTPLSRPRSGENK